MTYYEASTKYEAVKVARVALKVPKSKWGLLAVEPGYSEKGDLKGWIALFNSKKIEIYLVTLH